MRVVDENFINEVIGVRRPGPFNQPAFVPKGVVERGLEDSKPRKGLLKEACKDQTSEADVERGLEFTIHVGCCLNKRMVISDTISEPRPRKRSKWVILFQF